MTQAEGVYPSTIHFVAPWCSEDELPSGRLRDSNGQPIGDVPIGLTICAATEALFVRSGSKYRSGRSLVRPTQIVNAIASQSYLYPYSSMSGYGAAWGFGAGWSWSALGVGWWQNGQDLSEVKLQAPVRRINSVLVDGVELPPTAYTLYDRRRLVRNIDPTGQTSGVWPWNQQLAQPVTQPGTWQIDYEWGNPAPALGRLASIELSTALVGALSGQDPAGLPARVTSIQGQGLSIAVGDALQYLLADMTGLPICDLFLKTYNKSGKRRPSVFMSPSTVLNRSS